MHIVMVGWSSHKHNYYHNLQREYRDCKEQKRQDWDHKAYHDAPIAI